SLRLLDVAVEGETTIGVGAEPVRDSTQVGELHTLRAAAFKQLRGESLAGVHADVGEAYASTEDIRVLRSFHHSRAKHYPHSRRTDINSELPIPLILRRPRRAAQQEPEPYRRQNERYLPVHAVISSRLVMKARTFRGEAVVLPVRARGRDRCCD